jgi:hypothetical protein
MAHDVFISYAIKDKVVANAVCAAMESRKIRCWIAPRDILPGVSYAEAIIDAITSSRIMVMVFSKDSNKSQQVMREVERAVNKNLTIIPFRIEDVTPTKSMEYFLGVPHWLDALTPPFDKHLERLADAVQMLLSAQMEKVPETEPETPSESIKKSPESSYIFIAHVEEDADVALGIALGLEETGYRTWTYEIDYTTGPYILTVGEAVAQSDSMIVIISPYSISSREATKEVVRGHMSGRNFLPVLRNISHAEFTQRQPEWGEAMGSLTSIPVPSEGVAAILPLIIDGLKTLGIHPADKANTARIQSIRKALAVCNIRRV